MLIFMNPEPAFSQRHNSVPPLRGSAFPWATGPTVPLRFTVG